jgi:Helicase conserved C-terminal domain
MTLVVGTGENATTFGKSDYNTILTNFAPRAKKRDKLPSFPQDEEIDLLIATDCISEGQNLQDCDYLINYDIHWNPVRLIQRFGRIDRIGSQNEAIQMVNFWPTEDLNAYLDLKNRVEARMALVDLAATGQDNPLTPDQIRLELSYRDQQLLRLKDEVLDLEDLNESVTLADFSLDDFRADLMNFLDVNRKLIENAPLGLFAMVEASEVAKPGVIFCLRQHTVSDDPSLNPLHPHYLVYVQADGNVRLSHAQPKQVLDLYRSLCADKTEATQHLHDLFDDATQNGQQMAGYSKLLESTLASIRQTFKRRATAQLFSERDALLPKQEDTPEDESQFELITWLIIAEPAS